MVVLVNTGTKVLGRETRMRKLSKGYKRAGIAGVAAAALIGGAVMVPSMSTAAANPSEDACAVTSNSMPTGNCGPFVQTFTENFNGDTIPLGAFSDCNNNVDTKEATCEGLASYPEYYANWWAYPSNWEDTAYTGADGNTGAPFGGVYRADLVTSVTPTGYDGTGTMKVDMHRPSTGGSNRVAAMVPRKCMEQQYGKYTERFKVTRNDGGFKSAHLFYQGGQEIDFPENDYGDVISGYTHPQGGNWDTGVNWDDGSAHTTSIEWTPNTVKLFLDGELIGEGDTAMPAASWILQNESSINGPYAAPGAHSILETTWVTCYKYDPDAATESPTPTQTATPTATATATPTETATSTPEPTVTVTETVTESPAPPTGSPQGPGAWKWAWIPDEQP